MPMFAFEARTAAGLRQAGREESPSAASLAQALKGRGWMVLKVEPAANEAVPWWNPATWLHVRSLDVELALSQMAVMLKSGLTLLTSLRTAAEQCTRLRMAAVLNAMADRIQQGSTLADAMAQHMVFPHLAVQLTKVGEATGTLDAVLQRAVEAIEARRTLRTQIFTALFYPVIVLVAAIGVAAFIVLYLIPKLKTFLAAFGKRLPPITQALVDVADFFQANGAYLLTLALTLIFALVALYLWPPGRLFLDRALLRLPIVGRLLRLGGTAQFAHATAVLLQSGVTLVEGLRTTEALFRNRFLANITAQAREAVLAGSSLAAPLSVPGGFLPMLSKMAGVGETSGALDDLMGETARFHEAQLQASIRRFSVIIEPVIILVVGGIVGFVYIAFFMALFSVAGGGR